MFCSDSLMLLAHHLLLGMPCGNGVLGAGLCLCVGSIFCKFLFLLYYLYSLMLLVMDGKIKH